MTEIITSIDQTVLESLYAIRDISTVYMLIWITELGGLVVISGLTLCIALALTLKARFAELAGLIISVALSVGAVYTIKHLVERARPNETFQAYIETGFSFPSGHATMALALYGFIVWLLWRNASTVFWRVALPTSAVIIIGIIGFSRLYLGLHWASDVLAGFALAGFFVRLGIIVVKRFERL